MAGRPASPHLAQRLAASAVAVSAFSLLSKLLGFGREAALAAAFGATGESDAYLVALVVPSLVFGLIGEILLTASLPVLAGHVNRGQDGAAFTRLLWTLFHGALLLAGLLVAAGVLLAEPMTSLVAPGLAPATHELAVALTRLVMPTTLFLALANWATAILHAHQRFLGPALIGIPYNVILIVAALLAGRFGGIHWVAWATVAAVAAQAAILLPGLRSVLPAYAPALDLRDPELARVGRLALPVLAGLGVGSINLVVDRMLASGLAEGTVSVVNYAARAALVPLGLLSVPVITVLYPTLSARATGGDLAATRSALTRGLAALGLVMVPAAILMVLLAEDVTRFLFERGAFGPEDTARTAPVLAAFGLGLPFMAWRDYLTRACYALENGGAAVRSGAVAVAVNVALNLALVRTFGAPALAFSTSVATVIQCGLLAAALRRRLGGVGGRELAGEGWRIGVAAAVLAAAAVPLRAGVERAGLTALAGALVEGVTGSSGLAAFAVSGVRIGLVGLGAVAVYALACRALRVRTFAIVEEMVRRPLRRAGRAAGPEPGAAAAGPRP